MNELLRQYGPPVLMWVFLMARALRTRGRRDDPTRTIWGALLGLAVSMTVLTPAMYEVVWRLTGVPNLARLLGHLSMLVAAWSSLAFMRQIGTPREHRRPPGGLVPLAAFATALTVLFALAGTEVNDIGWAGRYAERPFVLEYWLVYLAYLGPVFGLMGALGWRYSRLVGDLTIRIGLRLVAVGAACAVAYHVHRAFFFAWRRLGHPYDNPAAIDLLLPFVAITLALLGASMPVWGRWAGVARVIEWLGMYRTYQALRPLWLDLYRANPQIALVPPRWPAFDLLVPYDLRMRLYRRVVEIRDGRLAMQPYMDPAVAEAALAKSAGSSPVAEAIALAAALRARAMGARPAASGTGPPVPGGADLDSDTTFLREVARAYRRHRGGSP